MSKTLHLGGAERFASRLLSGLDPNAFSPRLVLFREEVDYPLPDHVPVEALGYGSVKDLPAAILKLRRLLKKHHPHVILGTGTAVNVVAGCALKTLKDRPSWIARVDTNPLRRDFWFRGLILKALYPLAHRLVANSKGLRGALARRYAKLRPKIEYIYNPVDFDQLDQLAREKNPAWQHTGTAPLLATVGRAFPRKGWMFLLTAFASLIRTTPAELVLCGDGPLLAQLRKRVDHLNLGDHVHLLGHCDNPFSILTQADLFVLSSSVEGLPNALIEAQGMGLCAVSTNCDFGPDEIVAHGQTGLLVDVDDQDQWLKAVGRLLSDENMRRSMGDKAKRMVRERFKFERRCSQWERLLIEAADSGCAETTGKDGAT